MLTVRWRDWRVKFLALSRDLIVPVNSGLQAAAATIARAQSALVSYLEENPVSHDVIMPQMGESIAEGTITTWLKKVGDRVERDEPLFEISTDKVDAEIPSPAGGTLTEIKVQPGQTVAINTVVAVIAEAGAQPAASTKKAEPAPAVAASAPAEKVSAHAPTPTPSSVEERRQTKSSPLVRKIAAEHGVTVADVPGTGISGRVTKTDIVGYIEQGGTKPKGAPTATAPRTSGASPGVVSTALGEVPEAFRPRIYEGDRVEDLSVMRTKIAEHMVWSRRISAHVQTVWDVDFSRVAKLRDKHKAAWEENHGVKLTYNAFILKVVVDALKAFPILNGSMDLEGRKLIYHHHVNLGFAVALDWGLIVPVIHAADELNTLGLARRAIDLATRARTKKLKPDEVQAGTFTITNPGQYGQLFGLPVINQPQVAILGVGAIEKRPVVIDDMLAIRTRGYLSISFDHRLIDGAVAEQFMSRVRKGIEEFDEADL